MHTHEMFIIPSVIDASVVHKQATMRLYDRRNPEETVVHEHAQGKPCNDRCVIYKFPQMECPDCGGTGRKQSDDKKTGASRQYVEPLCPTCKGMGEVRDPDRDPGDEKEEVGDVSS